MKTPQRCRIRQRKRKRERDGERASRCLAHVPGLSIDAAVVRFRCRFRCRFRFRYCFVWNWTESATRERGGQQVAMGVRGGHASWPINHLMATAFGLVWISASLPPLPAAHVSIFVRNAVAVAPTENTLHHSGHGIGFWGLGFFFFWASRHEFVVDFCFVEILQRLHCLSVCWRKTSF